MEEYQIGGGLGLQESPYFTPAPANIKKNKKAVKKQKAVSTVPIVGGARKKIRKKKQVGGSKIKKTKCLIKKKIAKKTKSTKKPGRPKKKN